MEGRVKESSLMRDLKRLYSSKKSPPSNGDVRRAATEQQLEKLNTRNKAADVASRLTGSTRSAQTTEHAQGTSETEPHPSDGAQTKDGGEAGPEDRGQGENGTDTFTECVDFKGMTTVDFLFRFDCRVPTTTIAQIMLNTVSTDEEGLSCFVKENYFKLLSEVSHTDEQRF